MEITTMKTKSAIAAIFCNDTVILAQKAPPSQLTMRLMHRVLFIDVKIIVLNDSLQDPTQTTGNSGEEKLRFKWNLP